MEEDKEVIQEGQAAEKEEALTTEQAVKIEAEFMEDAEPIKLSDGNTYLIPPLLLRDAKKLMKLLGEINIDNVLLNFVPDENGEDSEQKLFEVLLLGFKYNYPSMTAERLEEICTYKQARRLIATMIGLNNLKK